MFLVRPAAIGLVLLTLWYLFLLIAFIRFQTKTQFRFIAHFFFCRSVLVYYLRSKSKARIEMVKLLKQMLLIEAKDKAFLLANITRVTQNNGKSMCSIQLFGTSFLNFPLNFF